jgi:hypothetical protein
MKYDPVMTSFHNDTVAGVSVVSKHSPLAFILVFFKPKIRIDQGESAAAWKTPVFVSTNPGQREVTVFFPYPIVKEAGKATIIVTVPPGQTVHLRYRAPWLVFRPGSLTVAP